MIRKFLDLSTAHLPPESDPMTMPGVIADRRSEYGWWVWVPDDVEDSAKAEEIPPPAEMLAIQRYARSRDCDWLLFDCDGPRINDLPTWEW